MLTKSQQFMVDDGLPASLLLTGEQRAAFWLANPHLGVIPTLSFKDDKRQVEVEREQFEREAAAIRITKLKAGLARKAVKLSSNDLRGMRWDARRNRLVPIDPTESRKMTDTEKTTADEATPELVSSTVAVTEEDTTMAKTAKNTAKKTPAKPAKKAAKKAAAKPAKKAAKKAAKKSSDKPSVPRGEGVIATIIKTIGRANGASADEILEVLVKAFPDRQPESMRKTIMIQANKNAKSKERSEKRGVVYYGHK